jgi:hypothetical protein
MLQNTRSYPNSEAALSHSLADCVGHIPEACEATYKIGAPGERPYRASGSWPHNPCTSVFIRGLSSLKFVLIRVHSWED